MRERIKTTNVLIRLSPEEKAQLEELAAYKGISMSAIINMLFKAEYRKMKAEQAQYNNN